MARLFDRTNPARMFSAFVPEDFLRETLVCVRDAYVTAYQHCQSFPKEDAHYIRPHYRNAVLARNWRELARGFEGIEARARLNRTGTAYHTRVRCGRVILTVSSVPERGKMVRHAFFRHT